MVCKNGDCLKNYVMMFSASWCRPCHEMYPRIKELREQGYIVYVFDVDKYTDASKRFKVQSLPTTIVMGGGKELKRFVGVVSTDQIKEYAKTKEQQNTTDYNFLD